MSNDLSWNIKVQDVFSKNFKKFNREVDLSTKKVAALDANLRKIQGNFSVNIKTSIGSFDQILKPLNQVQQKLKEFSYGGSSTLGKIQRGNQHVIRSNKELARSFSQVNNSIAPSGSSSNSSASYSLGMGDGSFGAKPKQNPQIKNSGNNISFGNVAKAVGFYRVADAAINFPAEIFNTRRQIDSLKASLEAILPQYDKTKTASQLAAEEMDYLTKTTYRLGISFKEARNGYVSFLAASAGKKDSLADVRKQFEAFSSLSRIYGISSYRFGLVINAMSQSKSKGKIMLEELQNQLGESLPGAVKLFADSLGISETKLRTLLSTTGVSANIFKKVADSILNDEIKMKGLAAASNTLDARTIKLTNSWEQFKITLTEGDASELAKDAVSGLDYAVQALTYSLGGLGLAWSDAKKALNEKLHPEIKRGKTIAQAQNFNDYIRNVQEKNLNMSLIPAGNSTPIPSQQVDVNVIFTNAPAGMSFETRTSSPRGNLGITTDSGAYR